MSRPHLRRSPESNSRSAWLLTGRRLLTDPATPAIVSYLGVTAAWAWSSEWWAWAAFGAVAGYALSGSV